MTQPCKIEFFRNPLSPSLRIEYEEKHLVGNHSDKLIDLLCRFCATEKESTYHHSSRIHRTHHSVT